MKDLDAMVAQFNALREEVKARLERDNERMNLALANGARHVLEVEGIEDLKALIAHAHGYADAERLFIVLPAPLADEDEEETSDPRTTH